jgi:hypothetical protein
MTSLPLLLAQLVLAAPEYGPPGTGGVVAAAMASVPGFRNREEQAGDLTVQTPMESLDRGAKDRYADESFEVQPDGSDERYENAEDDGSEHMRKYNARDDFRRRTRDLDPRRAPVGSVYDGVHRVAEQMPQLGDRAVVGPHGVEDDDEQFNGHTTAMLEERRDAKRQAANTDGSSLAERSQKAVASAKAEGQSQAQFFGDVMDFASEVHENFYTMITIIDYPFMCPCNFVKVPGGRRIQKTYQEGGRCISAPNEPSRGMRTAGVASLDWDSFCLNFEVAMKS